MPSQIVEIYDALSRHNVTLNGKTVPTRGLSNPPGSLTGIALPVRILHPYADQAEIRTAKFRGLGATSQISHVLVVVDFCAFAALGQGENSPPLLAMANYFTQYDEMLKTFRGGGNDINPAITAILQEWDLKMGIYAWPVGTENWWHGVQAVLQIKELA